MRPKWVTECWRHGTCKKRRTFRTADAAVDFANTWLDDHYEQSGWDVQVIAPDQQLHQMGINGNNTTGGMR